MEFMGSHKMLAVKTFKHEIWVKFSREMLADHKSLNYIQKPCAVHFLVFLVLLDVTLFAFACLDLVRTYFHIQIARTKSCSSIYSFC